MVLAVVLALGACSGGDSPYAIKKDPAPATGSSGSAAGSSAPGSAAAVAAASTAAVSVPGMSFKLGDLVDVRDSDGDWNEAMVIEVSADGYTVVSLYDNSGSFAAADHLRPPGPWKVKADIQGLREDNRWYDGKVTAVNADRTYTIAYADGQVGNNVPESRVHGDRKYKRHRAGGGSSRGGGGSTSSGTAACVPSHYTRCGAECFDLQNNRYNCGACGRSCPRGMDLCNHGSCDCSEYDKSANHGACPTD